jgi:NAD(P)-dependent dehydrogenase (short-subunit alcohol dehydrogenase family)
MSERVAIVVGAGGELGRATAQKLAAAGFSVVGVDRNEDGLKALPDGIRYEVGDATDAAVARALVERIAAEVGPPEVLVNTIGTYHLGGVLDTTPEDLRLMVDVNAGTALWLTQAVVPYMRDRGTGVNAVAPQLLDTAETREFLPDDVLAHAVSPEAVADVIVFLASDAAAPVSGAVVPAYGS